MTAGIVVFAHGSRVESANEAVRAAAAGLARAGGFEHVEAAFLELGSPDLAGAVERLYTQGLRRIVVVPYFLTLGLHMERDLPVLIQNISRKYNDLAVSITPPLDGHPGLVQAMLDRAQAALLESPTLN